MKGTKKVPFGTLLTSQTTDQIEVFIGRSGFPCLGNGACEGWGDYEEIQENIFKR